MAKLSNRDRILTAGLKVVHAHGFAGASVRDIVQAAGVPQGSFTNHFASKEDFGLEVIDLYFDGTCRTIAATLRNETLSPLKRLEAYIDANTSRLNQDEMRNGCLFGNFTAEACDSSERIRLRLAAVFDAVRSALATCLRDAVAQGECPPDLDAGDIAGFIVSSLQGANLVAKAYRSPAPVERFKAVLFGRVLARTSA